MSWPRKYDQIDPDLLRAWLAAGWTLKQMAGELGLAWTCTVRKAVRYYGIPFTPARSRHVATIEVAEVRFLYWEQGLTIKQIAAHYGICTSTVGHFMQRNGIPAAHRSRIPHPWHNREWLAARMVDHTHAEIAAEQGCHVQTIIKAAKGFGFTHDHHPRRLAKRAHAHQVIQGAYRRVAQARAKREEPKSKLPDWLRQSWPECPDWLAGILAKE